jgi:hypothetical protein
LPSSTLRPPARRPSPSHHSQLPRSSRWAHRQWHVIVSSCYSACLRPHVL